MGTDRFPRAARFCLLAVMLLLLALPVKAQSSSDTASKIVNLMQTCNYNFQTTRSPRVWVIRHAGNHLKDMKIAVTVSSDEQLVVFVTVAEKRRLPETADFMRTLLEQNHTMDRVKIGFDGDGDLSLRIDAKLRVTDAAEFHEIVNQTENAADEVYGLIESKLQD